jgi:hypothetical protein
MSTQQAIPASFIERTVAEAITKVQQLPTASTYTWACVNMILILIGLNSSTKIKIIMRKIIEKDSDYMVSNGGTLRQMPT